LEIIEPFHGRIFDPACGSGGMFVHSAHFVERHRHSPGDELSAYGQEKTGDTVRLAKMDLAIHGLSGEIREGNSYYDDLHDSVGRFDYVMANPPFNVDRIDTRPSLPASITCSRSCSPSDPVGHFTVTAGL
jgi:type I restriction enzyme M protein